MPGRKKPQEREEDRDREYRLQQKRSYGEDSGDDIPAAGAAVEREREEWADHKDRLRRRDF